MGEEDVVVPSTVVLPEPIDEAGASPTQTHKRRASSTSSSASKRRRLDPNDPLPTETKASSTRRDAVDVDERKRGKRLFGGLLGTLSQKSSSTAQKRRVDIERKQREKLRAQKEEDEEVKRSRQEEIDAARRTKQKIWDAESWRARHENERALAKFLKTKALPALYYKPWELRSEEEDLIKRQVEEVERKLGVEENEKQHSPQVLEDTQVNEQQQDQQPSEDINMDKQDNESPNDNSEKADTSQIPHLSNGQLSMVDNEGDQKVEDLDDSNQSPKRGGSIVNENHASPDAMKDHMEEVIQGDEDAVLY